MQSALWIENEIKKWNIEEKGEIGCSLTVVWSQNLKDSFCKTGMLQTQLRYDCAAFPPQVSEKTEEWNTNLKEKIETGSEPKHRAAGETVKTRSKIQQGQWILAAKEILTPPSKGTKSKDLLILSNTLLDLQPCGMRCLQDGKKAPGAAGSCSGDKSSLWDGTAPPQLSSAAAENLLEVFSCSFGR